MEQAGDAAGLLKLLEASAIAQAAKTSTWVYPLVNTAHVLGIMVFFTAVAVMDIRLLGGFRGTQPGPLLRSARFWAVLAFMIVAATGFVMFTAEATPLVSNTAFLLKMALIGIAAVNLLAYEVLFARRVATIPAGTAIPERAALFALASLGLWLGVAAAGRMIAYV